MGVGSILVIFEGLKNDKARSTLLQKATLFVLVPCVE